MYCPTCATRLAETSTHCPHCGLDVRPIAQLLDSRAGVDTYHSTTYLTRSEARRWKQQRHSWGLLLIFCSLLVGCFIPISIGLLSQSSALGSLITVQAGLAGLLLLIGSLLILASENLILVADGGDQPERPRLAEARDIAGHEPRRAEQQILR